MQVPTKVDPSTKERSCKRGAVGAKGAVGINMILKLLEGVLGGLRIWNEWLEPRETSLCRTLSSSEGLFRYTQREPGQGLEYSKLEHPEGLRCLTRAYFTRNLWARLGHYTRQSGVVFCKCKSLVPLLRSGVWYRPTELLQTDWLTCWVWRNENCKREVAHTRLGHVLLQKCSAWMDEAQLRGYVDKSANSWKGVQTTFLRE